jgi:hypothetical protein
VTSRYVIQFGCAGSGVADPDPAFQLNADPDPVPP